MGTTKVKRSRLSPHDRRMQLLDCARDIILERGFASLTMESVATQANVSNPLIYKYFDSRLSLLQELSEREIIRFYTAVIEELEEGDDFHSMLHIAVRTNFDEVANGNILSILRSQPDIESGLDKAGLRKKLNVGPILIQRTMNAFPVTRAQAAKIVAFGSGASQAAAMLWRQQGGDRDKMIEDAIAFIYAGAQAMVSNK